jgi:hypothetical protein
VRVTWGGAACDPSAGETLCNGYDDDCDGLVDEGLTTTYYVDADFDGHGDASLPIQACVAPAGYSPTATDCDDTNGSVHPGASESCDGVDQNCDGQVDEGNPGGGSQCTTGMSGICARGLTACVGGAVTCAPKYPATAEACLDGLDNDCDGLADEGCDGGSCPAGFNASNGACVGFYIIEQGQLDNLGSNCTNADTNYYNGCSSAPYGFHWDDVDPGVGPLSGVEVEFDEGVSCLSSPTVTSATINGTAVGNYVAHANQCTCTPVSDAASVAVSAQAANATYTPGGTNYFALATQTNCAGLSRNPLLAEAFARVKVTWGGAGCDPTYAEICNGFDDDCDGQVDEGVASTFYADTDVDGYGDPNAPAIACSIPPGHMPNAADCDDTNASIHPGVAEVCDGVDQNCDAFVDEGNPGGGALCTSSSPGICAAGTTVCSGGGFVCVPSLSPTTDTCLDGVDQDCDGIADEGCDGGVCPNGMNLVGGKCVKVYLIELGSLDNLGANCDGTQVSYYNGCTSSPYGFHWTDVGGGLGPVTDVDVELREGLTCRTTPTTNAVTLNGTAAGGFTQHANQCGCTPSSFTDATVANLPVGAYAQGGTNVLSIGTSTSCEGLSKNPAWGDGFARVFVTY